MQIAAGQQISGGYAAFLRRAVAALAVVAGVAVALMIVVTCVDVIGRRMGRPLKGAYDLIELLGAIAITGALPYTTVNKGHVAIEFLLQKLSGRGRTLLIVLAEGLSLFLFAFLTWRFFQYGGELRASGQVTLTLRWPVFWLP
ncbi:MAG: TRAP transporter small permease [Planctomycetes bacterium]|nr:TRAP transporter small permease [Planctomycetota bacterium]